MMGMVIAQRVKKGLSAFNDKVYQISPGASRPEGHWRKRPAANAAAQAAEQQRGAESFRYVLQRLLKEELICDTGVVYLATRQYFL